jgi:citrate lyase subunit gamma (acyl carrier protein)
MRLTGTAKAGTLESSDILIIVMPQAKEGIEIELQSIVMPQFGRQIRETILKAVKNKGANHCRIMAQDRGALDYTIEARVETALARALGTPVDQEVR